MSQLFTPIKIKDVTIKNRVFISPMCQYSSIDGHPTDWHLVHLGARAAGGAGLVMVEATAVMENGRISPQDSGIYSDQHILSFKKIASFIEGQGAIPAIQLAHAGRKASVDVPWNGGKVLAIDNGGWQTIAPSAIAFSENSPVPKALSEEELEFVKQQFVKAAKRAYEAGFKVIELHMAHGYLLHEFLSPLSNQRTDKYGMILENRMRFPLDVTKAVREVWPDELPLFVRISATDWYYGEIEQNPDFIPTDINSSWNLQSSIQFSKKLKELGVDLIDCSSGGLILNVKMAIGAGYQVAFSNAIKHQANILTSAVGLITEPQHAEAILENQQADAIMIGRASLRNPNWPIDASHILNCPINRPNQYLRC